MLIICQLLIKINNGQPIIEEYKCKLNYINISQNNPKRFKINPPKKISEKGTHAIGQSGDTISQSNKNSTKTATHNVLICDTIIEGKNLPHFNQMIRLYTI